MTCPLAASVRPPIVVLVETSHPGNVGASARGARNFGVEQMRFVRPRCDVKCKEAMDRSVHAKELLAEATVHDDLASALHGVGISVGTTARTTTAENRHLRKPTDVRDWAEALTDVDTQVALVFGPEDTGLRAEHVDVLDQLVCIPTSDYASLNLAHAVTMLCYEHFRVRETARITPERSLAPDTLAALNKAWDDLTVACEPRAWRRRVSGGIWRKIMGRAQPADHEVHNIMGVLTNALRRFDHPDYATEKSSRYLKKVGLLAEPVEEE